MKGFKFLVVILPFLLIISATGINERDITLISKSSGLENPDKEEGYTEYEVADLNNDGNLDIISVGDHGNPYVNSNEHGIMVWFGDGKGNWSVHQFGNFGYGGCEIGDLNNDGYMDIAWGVHHNWGSGIGDKILGAALGDGTANWTAWDNGLATNGESWGMFATDLADFDCDGDLDIVSLSFGCCNGIRVYENLGDGNWTQRWALTGDNAEYTLETGDINGDGYMDFVSTHWVSGSGSDIAFIGDGNFNFTKHDNGLPYFINAVDCKDMNNDGKDDIAVATSSGVFCYVYDESNDTWISKSNGLPSGYFDMVQFGDINGDGYMDMVCYSQPNGYVYIGDGTGNWTYAATWTMPSPGNPSALRVDGDIDHDGREDIIIQAEKMGSITNNNELRCYSPWQEPSSLAVRVVKPSGGIYRAGCVRWIKWLSAVPPSYGNSSANILLSTDGGSTWITIASNIPNSGKYQWIVPSANSSNCRIKVVVNAGGNSASATSSNFCILGASSFSVSANGPYYGYAGKSLHFTATPYGGSPPYTWLWDFGDGNTSSEQNPSHVFSNPGNYTITLSATDANNNTANDTTWALIVLNAPPVADFVYHPIYPMPGEMVYFNSTSYDSDGFIANYTWQFGDGGIAYGSVAMHAYDDYGIYNVTLTVKDNAGDSSKRSKYVIIGRECNISLVNGWNLITIYVHANTNASMLYSSIQNCSMILAWNASLRDFIPYLPGSPNDFSIEDGYGYFIAVASNSTIHYIAPPIKSVNITLYEGWNALGWFKEEATTAGSIYENISNCSMVLTWNASMQDFIAYMPGSPYNPSIHQGDGFFVAVSQQSEWHGEG